jgi:hypothetical protein
MPFPNVGEEILAGDNSTLFLYISSASLLFIIYKTNSIIFSSLILIEKKNNIRLYAQYIKV